MHSLIKAYYYLLPAVMNLANLHAVALKMTAKRKQSGLV